MSFKGSHNVMVMVLGHTWAKVTLSVVEVLIGRMEFVQE